MTEKQSVTTQPAPVSLLSRAEFTELRRRKGVTLADCALAAGVHISALSRWERGLRGFPGLPKKADRKLLDYLRRLPDAISAEKLQNKVSGIIGHHIKRRPVKIQKINEARIAERAGVSIKTVEAALTGRGDTIRPEFRKKIVRACRQLEIAARECRDNGSTKKSPRKAAKRKKPNAP